MMDNDIKTTTRLYPTVPELTDVRQGEGGEDFRLHKANDVLVKLENERDRYEKVRKKYSRWRSFFHTFSMTAGGLSALFTMGGIGTSLTDPGLAVGIPLSAVGGFMGIVSALCGMTVKKLTVKVSKHEKTIQLIHSKLNSINDLVSKALKNNKISEEEFTLILSEVGKYERLRNEIRRKKNEEFSQKKVFDIEGLRMEMKEELIQQLTQPRK